MCIRDSTHTHTFYIVSLCVETDFHYSKQTSKGTRGFVAVDAAVDVVDVAVFVGRLRDSYGPDVAQKIQRRATNVGTRCKEM